MISEWPVRVDVEGSDCGRICGVALTFCLEELRKTTENKSGKSVSGPRFDHVTYRIRSRGDNQWTAKFEFVQILFIQ
jgi:hypothetical protein